MTGVQTCALPIYHHMQKAMHHMHQAHKHHSAGGHEIMTHEDGPHYGTHAEMKGDAGAADRAGSRHNVFKGMVPSGESEMVKGGEHKFDGGKHASGVQYVHDRSHYKG